MLTFIAPPAPPLFPLQCECEYDYADPIGAARFKADGLTWDGDGICRDVTPSGLITLVTVRDRVE